MRKKISKSSAAVPPDEEVAQAFELTNITVKEVSLVDRAAIGRRFLVTKRDGNGEAKQVSTEPVNGGDASGVVEKTDAELEAEAAAELAAKDAKDKADYLAQKEAEATAERAKELAMTGGAPAKEEAPATVVEPVAAVKTGASVPAKVGKDDVTTEMEVLSIDSAPAAQAASARNQAAWSGAISALRERLDMLEASTKIVTADGLADYAVYGNIEYLRRMLDALYDIGGPEFDVEAAAQAGAATTKADVSKVGRAISGPRMRMLTEVRMSLLAANQTLEKLFKGLGGDETEKAAPVAETPAPAAIVAPVVTVVAPAPVTAAVVDDPVVKSLKETAQVQAATVNQLLATITEQAKDISKARARTRSNALTGEPVNSDNEVVWDRDMASAQSRARSRL